MNTQRKLAGLLALGAMSAAIAIGAPAYAAPAGTFPITNYGSAKCIGTQPGDVDSLGASIFQQTCTGGAAQQWTFDYVGDGYYHLVNAASHQCLDVRDGVNADWTQVQQWACTGTSSMAWKPAGPVPAYYPTQLKSKIGGRCLDVRYGSLADGAVIQIYHCTAYNTAQAWTFH